MLRSAFSWSWIGGYAVAGLLWAWPVRPARVPVDGDSAEERFRLWIDRYEAEPVDYEGVLEDLASVPIVYLGGRHGVSRHHRIQTGVVEDLAAREARLVLGLGPLEAVHQGALDRYAAGEISFTELAEATTWPAW